MKQGKSKPPHILDILNLHDIRLGKQRTTGIKQYYWEHYVYFAQKRSEIISELKHALSSNLSSFKFNDWQRIVSYGYALNPLSAKGSILNSIGGRFNIGNIDAIRFPKFAALYVAEDYQTAYRELFQKEQKNTDSNGLEDSDLALVKGKSLTIVALSGKLKVLNITGKACLKDFFVLVKAIKLPKHLAQTARKLNIDPMYHVKTLVSLYDNIMRSGWRDKPRIWDIPSNSQILGQIAHAAGIEAILYPSTKMKNSQHCLAVYPENFFHSDSYVEIQGDIPKELKFRRLDATNYKEFY